MADSMDAPEDRAMPHVDGQAKGYPGIWKAAPGYALALLCLLWVFHDVPLDAVLNSFGAIRWGWVAGAVLLDVSSYACQGLRWRLLLHPIGRLSTVRATQAIYAGLFVNEVLPMRLGEVLRLYLVSRWVDARFEAVVPSLLVERFFDAVWLALGFGITVFVVPLPQYLISAEEILGFTALAAAILFVCLVFRKKADRVRRPKGALIFLPLRRIRGFWGRMSDGVREIGRSRYLYSGFGISLFLLLGQVLSFWFVMLGYGLKLSVWHGAAVFLIVHIGTMIPGAPSNVGTYQFFTVVGLTLFGVEKPFATSFSVFVFLILTIPLWLIGLLVFGRLGLSLKKIQSEIATMARRGSIVAKD
jgi:glycosyltransferase 2 family protein